MDDHAAGNCDSYLGKTKNFIRAFVGYNCDALN